MTRGDDMAQIGQSEVTPQQCQIRQLRISRSEKSIRSLTLLGMFYQM